MKILILPLSVLFSGLFPFVFCVAKTDVSIFGKEISHKIIPVVDRDYFPTAKKLIQGAEKSICISMFVMKKGKRINSFVNLLIEELKNAAKRGLNIKILLESNIKANQSTVDSLRGTRNIEIKFDSPQKTTHNKIIIIDEDTILIGSTNWTEKSIDHANEANALIKDKEVTEYFQEYFDRLWKDSSKDISPFKNFTGDIIPLIDRQYFDVVNKLMSKATQRILVMVYGFKLSDTGDTRGDILANEMVKAKRRGVETTKVLLEKSNFSKQLNKMNRATIQYFKENGVKARFGSKDIITHSKVVIIDDAVILGATNWSYSGLEKWHNTDILLRKREIVDFFANYFEEKFNSNL